jgi:predicted permease
MSAMHQAGPPRAAEWLLQRLLDDRSRDAVLGDLHEGYASIHAHGATAARRWYWKQAVRSVIACRVTGQRQQESRRYDFDSTARVSVRDLLHPAMRQFRDRPLYSLASAGTLALAVGVACVSLTLVKQAFIDPLPYRAGHELVTLLTMVDGSPSVAMSPHVLEDLRGSAPPLVQFAPIRPGGAAYASTEATEVVSINSVDADYFALLGVSPSLGRIWTPQERDAVVISAAFWRERLGQDPNVIGTAIVLDGRPRTVVGVMPPDFVPPYFSTAAAWLPIDMVTLMSEIRTMRTLTILARRAPNASQADLDAYLSLFSKQEQERFPQMHGGQTWVAVSLRDELVGSARPALVATAAAALLLLLIVATNIAGLSTAHAVAVRHQLAVRAALGATRARLFVEQVVESVVLATVGSLAGIAIAFVLAGIVARYQQFFLARFAPIELDAVTILIGLGAGVTIGLTAAILPRSVVNVPPNDVLRSSRSTAGDVTATTTRTVLVVAQVAIALVLLVGAGLLVRTVQHLSQRELGFNSDGLTWFQVNLPGRKYQETDAQLQFERDVMERVRQIPGVTSSTASVGFPLWGGMMAGLAVKGDAPGTPRREIAYLSVSPNFVTDIGARIVAGRDLLTTDTFTAPRAVIINEALARQFWPKGNAIGAEVQIGAGETTDRWITIVGIMADMRAHGVTEPIRPTAFVSTLQYSWPRRHIGVRTGTTRPITLASELKSAIHAVDPAIAVGAITPVEQALSDGMARHRLVMLALVVFGTLALLLCISGLYAVIVLNSQQRRREYAIRVALGASRGCVRWMVVRQALMLAGAGAISGLMIAAAGTRVIQGLLQGVEPLDTMTFTAAAVALLALATLAAWQPASRAERVDPVEALRAE